MTNNNAIGIFDSGVGGLTVLEQIRKELPNENIIYLGDTKNFPYGGKCREDIIKYSKSNAEFLIEKGVKIIVVACGTATSQALEQIKDMFDIPIIGIIDPTVKYVKENNINKIGVMATEGTIRSGAWEKHLKKQIPDIKVENKACPVMATIAEEGRALSREGRNAIRTYIKPFIEKDINKIILGCTHYPIYQTIIKEEMPYKVELIDTGYTVARYLKKYLKENNIENKERKTKEIVYLTKTEESFKSIAQNILNCNITIETM